MKTNLNKIKKRLSKSLLILNGAPEGIRTPDLCLRRALLYPAELLAHLFAQSRTNKLYNKIINYSILFKSVLQISSSSTLKTSSVTS